jgi:hypothetical protein
LDANSYASVSSVANASTTALQVVTGLFDFANSDLYLYLNGALDNSNTAFQTNGVTSNTISSISLIGSATATQQYFSGDLCELIVFHAAHGPELRFRIWQYLRTKWGIV